jgi:NADH dehydrogenase
MGTVVVFGGTGFLGRRLVRRLAEAGERVRVAVRHPEYARSALGADVLERVEVRRADIIDAAAVAEAVSGADAVVNAVSAYAEKGGVTFEGMHVTGAAALARAAAAAGCHRFVLVSGIGADAQSASLYIRARGRGEAAVREVFPAATIARPGAMFGPGDALFGTVAEFARLLPALPLIGGDTRLQPAYVDDVAAAIARMLADPATAGQTYELAGPSVYSLRDLFNIALGCLDRRRLLVPIPLTAAALLARALELLPSPPLTVSQVDLLQSDNVASGSLPGFRELGIEPKTVEEIVPTYIGGARAA